MTTLPHPAKTDALATSANLLDLTRNPERLDVLIALHRSPVQLSAMHRVELRETRAGREALHLESLGYVQIVQDSDSLELSLTPTGAILAETAERLGNLG